MDEADSLFELGEISSINLDAMEPLSETSSNKIIDTRDLPLSKHERNRLVAMGE